MIFFHWHIFATNLFYLKQCLLILIKLLLFPHFCGQVDQNLWLVLKIANYTAYAKKGIKQHYCAIPTQIWHINKQPLEVFSKAFQLAYVVCIFFGVIFGSKCQLSTLKVTCKCIVLYCLRQFLKKLLLLWNLLVNLPTTNFNQVIVFTSLDYDIVLPS